MADGPVPEHEVYSVDRAEGDFDAIPEVPPPVEPSMMRSATLREMRERHERMRIEENEQSRRQ